eukprot:TRINITY_DN122411_c0_g1_i1.p1 TRINITY_DN122411_c0_g1~~TRINITY_DN122411_c0_g1_i1.p1  ORF type:complete len:799 (-),score=124.11 TRINITY_DN122411_c0_g1_i1:73-2469(-)
MSALLVVLQAACAPAGTVGAEEEALSYLKAWPVPALHQTLSEFTSADESLEVVCGQLFHVALPSNGSTVNSHSPEGPHELLNFHRIHEITQRLINCLGCRDTMSLQIIADVYSTTVSRCQEAGGVDSEAFFHHVRGILVQALAELSGRLLDCDDEPDSMVAPRPETANDVAWSADAAQEIGEAPSDGMQRDVLCNGRPQQAAGVSEEEKGVTDIFSRTFRNASVGLGLLTAGVGLRPTPERTAIARPAAPTQAYQVEIDKESHLLRQQAGVSASRDSTAAEGGLGMGGSEQARVIRPCLASSADEGGLGMGMGASEQVRVHSCRDPAATEGGLGMGVDRGAPGVMDLPANDSAPRLYSDQVSPDSSTEAPMELPRDGEGGLGRGQDDGRGQIFPRVAHSPFAMPGSGEDITQRLPAPLVADEMAPHSPPADTIESLDCGGDSRTESQAPLQWTKSSTERAVAQPVRPAPPADASWIQRAQHSFLTKFDYFADSLDTVFVPDLDERPPQTHLPEPEESLPTAKAEEKESSLRAVARTVGHAATAAAAAAENAALGVMVPHVEEDVDIDEMMAGNMSSQQEAFIGPQPLSPEEMAWRQAEAAEYRQRIKAIMLAHHPAMLQGLDTVLDKYAGREDELYASLCKKYGLAENAGRSTTFAQAAEEEAEKTARSCHPGLRAPSYDEIVEMLRPGEVSAAGLPVYARSCGVWTDKRLLLTDGDRYLYVLDDMAETSIEDTPCFEVRLLQLLTRRSLPSIYLLTLQFEEGNLLLRFSYLEMREALIQVLQEGRRIPVVDAPVEED